MKADSEGFAERLLSVLKSERQTYWATHTGQSQSAVSKWFQGSFPRSDKLLNILQLADVSANWLLLGIGPKRLSDMDEKEVEKRQEQGRKVQINLLELVRENEQIKERLRELERENSQNSIDWLFPGADKIDATLSEKERVFEGNIFPVLALMRQVNDLAYKLLEQYANEKIDDKKYREIAGYIKKTVKKNSLGLRKMLAELDDVI